MTAKRPYMAKRRRTIEDKLYTLDELRSVWQIRMSNRLLLSLMLVGIFPQPQRRAGRLVWREQDIVAYITASVKLASRLRWDWKNSTRVHLPDPGLATTRADHDRAATPWWITEGLPKPE